ncbi:hypothetical protein ACFPES_29005 [Paenibacillus sp. GCM10023248]|uniref:hypothetical protein n=1 Tax=unclassified Paenibacillus TaxID=185978 RepID=UPI002379611D|nr:hypothetical protein [Paenibacillus sp. MAHUQ-63]MDD9271093.1 hypothetical protein [Paenibacillus sp. MAHUQ-63]
MFLYNACACLVSVGALYSIRWIPPCFRSIEKLVYYMAIVVAIEQLHSAVLDNLKLLEFTPTLGAFVFFKINQMILYPIVTLWLLVSFYKPNIKFPLKLLYICLWFSALTGSYHLFQALHVLKLTGWNIGYAIVVWYAVLLESYCFSLVFRKLLGKRDARDPLST